MCYGGTVDLGEAEKADGTGRKTCVHSDGAVYSSANVQG